jgi:WD40 repeat protein
MLRDVFNNIGAAETPNGELALYDLRNSSTPPGLLPIPENPLGRIYAASLSDDFKYLALSGSVRGGVWNLTDGKMLIYIRGFRGASFESDGLAYLDFPATDQTPRSIAHFDPAQKLMDRDAEVKSSRATQYGNVLIRSRPRIEMKNGKETFDWSTGLTTLEAYDARTYNLLWSQEFTQGFPSYVPDGLFGTMVLGWWGNSKAVAAEMKTDAELAKRIGNPKDADDKYYFKIVDLKTGKTSGSLVLPTNKKSFKIVDAVATGDYFVAMDDQNRALIYSISSGKLLGHVFGSRATLSPLAGMLCVENESGQLNLYDLKTLEKRGQLSLGDRIKMVRFSGDGKRLAVVTANQIVSIFDVAGITAG